MNSGWQLLGLLALSFIGSGVARGRRVRGFGLPSGSEWLLTGIVCGPQVLRLVRPSELLGFAPLVAAGAGWIALTIGQRFGVLSRPQGTEEGSAGPGAVLVGILVAAAAAFGISAAGYALLGRSLQLTPQLRLASALTLGIALSGSTRQLIDWARERLFAKGRLTDYLEALVSGSELVALLGTAPLMALLVAPELTTTDWILRSISPIAVGTVLGLLALLLLRLEVRLAETWGILLGTVLFATGITLRIGASVIATGFVLGWILGRDRRSGQELRIFTHPTEGAVVLPLMVIAGAIVDWSALGPLGLVVIAAVVLRWVVQFMASAVLRLVLPRQGLSLRAMSVTLSSTGEIACLLGLGYWLVVPGTLGQVVLAAAVANCLLGELLGAWGIRHLLGVAGELGHEARSDSTFPRSSS